MKRTTVGAAVLVIALLGVGAPTALASTALEPVSVTSNFTDPGPPPDDDDPCDGDPGDPGDGDPGEGEQGSVNGLRSTEQPDSTPPDDETPPGEEPPTDEDPEDPCDEDPPPGDGDGDHGQDDGTQVDRTPRGAPETGGGTEGLDGELLGVLGAGLLTAGAGLGLTAARQRRSG